MEKPSQARYPMALGNTHPLSLSKGICQCKTLLKDKGEQKRTEGSLKGGKKGIKP